LTFTYACLVTVYLPGPVAFAWPMAGARPDSATAAVAANAVSLVVVISIP
jgi:hypothetical protein